MSNVSDRTNAIRNYIIRNVGEHPSDISSMVAKEFALSRQSTSRHLRNMVNEGIVETFGNTRAREYVLKLRPPVGIQVTLQVDGSLHEDEVWRAYIRPQLTDASDNVMRICEFGFTEMLNNVIDHSQSALVSVGVKWDGRLIQLSVIDEGVGIFNKLQSELGLSDPRHAILELSKGKLTTNEASHTGEGIFFTSKMFDAFFIGSGGVAYGHGNRTPGVILDFEIQEGTGVLMKIAQDASQTMNEVFEEFASGSDDFGFNKTWLALSLAQYENEDLISRSQAKRVLARIDRFKEVALDFTGVAYIGPSFADEIFRVFANTHREIQLLPIGANPEVERAIKRAEANRA